MPEIIDGRDMDHVMEEDDIRDMIEKLKEEDLLKHLGQMQRDIIEDLSQMIIKTIEAVNIANLGAWAVLAQSMKQIEELNNEIQNKLKGDIK